MGAAFDMQSDPLLRDHFRGQGPHDTGASAKARRNPGRGPLTGLVGAGTLAVGMAVSGMAAASAPQSPPLEPVSTPATTVAASSREPRSFDEALRSNQFIVLGDTDHRRNDQINFLARDSTFVAMQRAGVKHIFIEMPDTLQSYVDDYYAGRLSRDEMKAGITSQFQSFHEQGQDAADHMDALASVIERARGNGMQVHFADSADRAQLVIAEEMAEGNAVVAAYEQWMQGPRLTQRWHQMRWDHVGMDERVAMLVTWQQEHPDEAKAYVAAEIAKDPIAAAAAAAAERNQLSPGIKARLRADDQLGAEIRKLAGTDRSVIFFGNEHGGPDSPLLDTLGRARTAKLDLYPNQGTMQAEQNADSTQTALLTDSGTIMRPSQTGQPLLGVANPNPNPSTVLPMRRSTGPAGLRPSMAGG